VANEVPYEYYCGANVVVSVDTMPVLECAGLTHRIFESKRPLYGYSSRHYDAMSRGQIIVQGSLIVNYVHQDYLYRCLELGRENTIDINNAPLPISGDELKRRQDLLSADLDGVFDNEFQREIAADLILQDPTSYTPLVNSLQNKFWSSDDSAPVREISGILIDESSAHPHDLSSAVNIRASFGPRNTFNNYSGTTGDLISGVHFLGRGRVIQIDEEVIVEEYDFIARNIHTVKPDSIEINASFFDNNGEIDFQFSTSPVDIQEGF
jgi:hypothetical protein